MSEWGLPVWRDPGAYPADASEWTSARWIWEFTRRRPDYREETLWVLELMRHAQSARARKMTDSSPDAKCACNTLQQQHDQAWRKHWRRWGYSCALDPRVSDYPQDDLLRWPHGNVSVMHGSPPERQEHRNTLSPKPGEIAVTINLDRPLEKQLATVTRVAKEEQRKRHGSALERRRRTEKWPGYLRALDAREAGATWAEITAQFFDDGILGRRKCDEGGYGPPPKQAARRLFEAGQELQYNFPN